MKRIVLKLSGEVLANDNKEKIYDMKFVDEIAGAIKEAVDEGYEIGLVVGAGNIWRGREGVDMDRVEADRMGMLATVINAICMKDAIKRAGGDAVVMTSVPMEPLAERYSGERAIEALESGKVVVFGSGLGIPFLSTDTTGAVRSAEIKADAMLMAKSVDYIYDDDPEKNEEATKLENVKASEVLGMNLKALDATATAFCLSTGMPIKVFGLKKPSDIIRAIHGEVDGTVVIPE